jgi:hypothetical protein
VKDLSAKLESVLARLEKSAEAGEVTREQFAELRAMFIHRARAAAKDGAGPVGPAEGRRRAAESGVDSAGGRTGTTGGAQPKPLEPTPAGGRTPKESKQPVPVTNPPAPAPTPATNPPKDDKPQGEKPGGEKPSRPNPPSNGGGGRDKGDG